MDETLPTVPNPRIRLIGAVAAVLLSSGCASAGGRAVSSAAAVPALSPASEPATAAAPSSTAPPRPTAAQLRRQAETAVDRLAAKQPHGAISVAALNPATGQSFTAGQRSGMWTASAYKLFVLETLLWQRHGALSGYEAAEAEPMIENSDNEAGYSLFLDAGGNAGLDAAARRFGMRHTVPGIGDPTFTRTSASDFLILARNLVANNGPLTPAARKYALTLMADVEADQRWGVSAAADKDSPFYSKNGWLSIDDSNGPGDTDDGRWAVTSVGVIRCHHQPVLMAVFTQHQPDMGAGVRLVEKLARAIVPAVTTAA
jgi:hypothetical protein